MGWKDGFWSTCHWIVDTGFYVTASTLNTLGTFACTVGGVGYAASFVMDETLNTNYYASAAAEGTVEISAEFFQFDYNVTDTIPFSEFAQKSGGTGYNLKDYLHPETVRAGSVIISATGTLLKILGANIKYWHEGRISRSYFKESHGMDISSSSVKEQAVISAEALLSSLSYICLSTAMTGALIQSGIINTRQRITYPLEGNQWVSSSHYHGPVMGLTVPINYSYSKNVSIELFGEYLLATFGARLNAIANATYGGGLFFEPVKDRPSPPVVIPAMLGASAYLAKNFFSRNVKQMRDERAYQAISDERLWFKI